jgi:hypothetical protein
MKKTYTYDVSIPYYHHFLIQSEKPLTREQVLEKAHQNNGIISGYDDEHAEITGILKKDFSNADNQIADLQDEIKDHYTQIEQLINQIDYLYKGRNIEEEAPIPYCVDTKGILHAPEAFKRNIRDAVKDIVKDVEKNKKIIEDALMVYIFDNGYPKDIQEQMDACQDTS